MKRLIALIAVCSIAFAAGMPFRFRTDLTDNRRYSLAPYTREILSGLDSEVKTTWYRSVDIDRYAENSREIEGCLRDFRSASKGRVSYDIRDPSANDIRVDIESLGLQGRGETKAYYSGLLVEHEGKSDVIPFVADRARLEYDLLVSIISLRDAERSAIQLIFALPGGAASCPYVIPWLGQSRIDGMELALPARDIDVSMPLVVIGSTEIDSATAKAIDTFLDGGGNAAFFVSGATVVTNGDWSASAKSGDSLLGLLSRRGIVIDDGIVMDESCWRMALPSVDGTKYELIDYPYWPRIIPERSAQPPSIALLTSGVGNIQFFWPSNILIDPSKDGLTIPIIESSANAIIERAPFATDPFEKGIDRLRTRTGKSRKHLAIASETDSRLVCVADELFAGSMVDYTDGRSNLDFLVNCAEWLSRKDGLLSVKESWPNVSAPTATETDSMAEYYARVRVAMLIVMPSLVICFYAIVLFVRKRRRA